MIILRQILRLHSVRRFAAKSKANIQNCAKMSLLYEYVLHLGISSTPRDKKLLDLDNIPSAHPKIRGLNADESQKKSGISEYVNFYLV
jgi:hypothetical protein